jgi:hypothetical protein
LEVQKKKREKLNKWDKLMLRAFLVPSFSDTLMLFMAALVACCGWVPIGPSDDNFYFIYFVVILMLSTVT